MVAGGNKRDNKARAAREAALEEVMTQYETVLLRYATRVLNNPASAEDVVQNVFIKLFRSWEPGADGGPENLKSWLYRVTHNEAVDHIRRESRLRLLHERHAEERQGNCTDGEHCGSAPSFEDKKALVLSQLRKLHPREQQVVLLRLEEGLSYKEISAITGRSSGNVGNILYHAVRKLSENVRTLI
jgi:RNA polymerase sigma-70 factor (ECF subfamily)